MTRKHLTIFTQACRLQSFSKAAQALGTTQPAVSLAIRELEEHYGTKLFERMNRRVYLTPAGEALYQQAQNILRGFQQAEEQLRQAPARLRVGANVTLGAARLPALLAQFRQRCPQVRLSALVANSREVEEGLLENRLDLGLLDNLTFSQHLRALPLFQEDMAALAAPGSPYAPGTLAELAACPLLLREEGSGVRRCVDRVFEAAGLSPQPFLESASTQALLEAAQAGLGVAIVPPELGKRQLAEGSLIPLALEGVRFPRQYYAALHRQKDLSPALEAFLALLGT